LSREYPVTLHPDPDGGYVAEVHDLPGCISQGDTRDEALAMIDDAREAWIRSAHVHGDPVPLPSADATYSGKILLRMPRSLHRRLAELAAREGVSLNHEVVSLLSERAATPALARDPDDVPESVPPRKSVRRTPRASRAKPSAPTQRRQAAGH
jgi:predicted RNase H-like HicB family nuclease